MIFKASPFPSPFRVKRDRGGLVPRSLPSSPNPSLPVSGGNVNSFFYNTSALRDYTTASQSVYTSPLPWTAKPLQCRQHTIRLCPDIHNRHTNSPYEVVIHSADASPDISLIAHRYRCCHYPLTLCRCTTKQLGAVTPRDNAKLDRRRIIPNCANAKDHSTLPLQPPLYHA